LSIVEVKTGYVPRKWQAWAHSKVKRHNILVFHRRGGKTVWAVNELIDRAVGFDKKDRLTGKDLLNPQFAYIAPTYGQAKNIAWNYFKQYAKDLPDVKFYENELKLTFTHPRGTCTIFLFGVENFEKHRGIYLDGYVLDEFADMHPEVRDKVLLPVLSDRGGWEIIIGTPKGDNPFKHLYMAAQNDPEWFSCLFKASMTGIIPDDELSNLKRSMTPEAYSQEYECDFNAAPSGNYYQKQIDEARLEGRIGKFPYDPAYPVLTYWDLGFSDSTAIWFIQEIGHRPRIIRYMEFHGKGLDTIVKELGMERYTYLEHCLPHDALHHELSTGRTRVDFLTNCGIYPIRVLSKSNNVSEDIHAVRQVLPMCYFDEDGCELGIKALSAYERKWDARRQVYLEHPHHNWASHGADAFRGFAVDYQPDFSRRHMESKVAKSSAPEYDILDF